MIGFLSLGSVERSLQNGFHRFEVFDCVFLASTLGQQPSLDSFFHRRINHLVSHWWHVPFSYSILGAETAPYYCLSPHGGGLVGRRDFIGLAAAQASS
jgi:hypothetical protein